ncbi:hypothetical protein SAMN05421819_4147 [Bryocella elongata]|uniref:Uncharacterized protein n=1 Tax=Bryocella elongata TaxID=863522 RepID=A0A1H6C138_9BACT|nr:hypothetical protein [Bryocella elongata]SEG66658.1 hypothetical protein SAMN05421819_4147 [Bryocella elongata]
MAAQTAIRPDTRKLLMTGGVILLVAAIAALLLYTVLGGVTKQGPHNNAGWLALMLVMGAGPTAVLTLVLGLAKLIGDLRGRE